MQTFNRLRELSRSQNHPPRRRAPALVQDAARAAASVILRGRPHHLGETSQCADHVLRDANLRHRCACLAAPARRARQLFRRTANRCPDGRYRLVLQPALADSRRRRRSRKSRRPVGMSSNRSFGEIPRPGSGCISTGATGRRARRGRIRITRTNRRISASCWRGRKAKKAARTAAVRRARLVDNDRQSRFHCTHYATSFPALSFLGAVASAALLTSCETTSMSSAATTALRRSARTIRRRCG